MQASFNTAATIRDILDAVASTVVETCIEFTDHGMSFKSMDTAHVALVELNVPVEKFSSYSCPQPVTIALSLHHLGRILKCADRKEHSVTFVYTLDADVLGVHIQGKDQQSYYELKLMNIENDQLSIPDMKHIAQFVLPSAEFKTVVSNFAMMDGDTVELGVSKDGHLVMKIEAAITSANVQFKSSQSMIEITNSALATRVSFQLKYLAMFIKASVLSDTVEIKFEREMPLSIRYGVLTFHLAPKIQSDEEQMALMS